MDSQAIVNTMEVLETKPINELVSEAIIKVCYVSDAPNPNDTVITRAVGKEIAATLPGAPVAGFFNKETGDFEQHSRKVTFENGKFNVEDITKPYGFVSPVDNPWYQDFKENGTVKTYLMCKAYLWTRQYEEASLAFGKGQSMELDEKAMAGYYQGDVFVFTTATLDKLCILGDAYAPCFAGAKIMSTYAKQYESLAEKLEKTIGRRYYVMQDQLVVKPDKITLEYALELGWNLSDAVYVQLSNRGAEDKYNVEGIYTEAGAIFAILRDRETLEFVRCDITITSQDTVELSSEMVAVTQSWAIKAPPAPEAVESLSGGEAVPNQEIPLNVTAVYTEGEGAAEGEPEVSEAPVVEVPAEDPPATEFTAEGTEGEVDPAVPPVTEFTTDGEPEIPVVEEPVVDAPAIDYTAQYSVLTAQITDYIAQLAAKDVTIEELNGIIAEYRKAEGAALTLQKEELITSYKSLLTEEEIEVVNAKIGEYSLEEVESKLAITYARKQKGSGAAPHMQVNIGSIPAISDLPDYIKQAQEYDKAQEFRVNL